MEMIAFISEIAFMVQSKFHRDYATQTRDGETTCYLKSLNERVLEIRVMPNPLFDTEHYDAVQYWASVKRAGCDPRSEGYTMWVYAGWNGLNFR